MAIQLKVIEKQLTYIEEQSITYILNDLKTILQDIQAKSEPKFKLKVIHLTLILIIGIIIIFIFFKDAIKYLTAILLLSIVFWMSSVFATSFRRKTSYPDYYTIVTRSQVAMQILQMLGRDIDSTRNIGISLLFKNARAQENLISTANHPKKAGYKIDNYKYEWLTIKGQFLDKNQFTLSFNELAKTQYGRKSKTKKVGLDVNLILIYHQEHYDAIQILKDEAINAIVIPDFCKIRKFKVSSNAMELTVRVLPIASSKTESLYETVTMMFLSFYQVMNLAKMLKK